MARRRKLVGSSYSKISAKRLDEINRQHRKQFSSIKKLSDVGNRDGYQPSYGVTFPDPFFKCSAAHRQCPADNLFFIETENIDCMVDMRDFPNFSFEDAPRFNSHNTDDWWSKWCGWHEAKILAVAKFFHLQHCKICLYNMIRKAYFPKYPELQH